MNRKIRILIVSNTVWDDRNSFGSSFSNIFGETEKYEIANIACSFGIPNTKVANHFFQITYKSIISKILRRSKTSGKIIQKSQLTVDYKEPNSLHFSRRHRWQLLFWIQDLIWASGKWKSKELNDFIDGFNPDIIFQPLYYAPHPNRIGAYASKRAGVPMIGYTSDDHYSLRQFSFSPLFWIDRFIKRRLFKKYVNKTRLLYVITETQRKEYDKYFGVGKCKVLFKGGNFKGERPNTQENFPLKFLYTGNLGFGRAETLGKVAKAIARCNKKGKNGYLEIYSSSPLSHRQLSLLNIEGASEFKGMISSSKVFELQKGADVLIHVESFNKVERYKSRLSFSTKIVDYMQAGKPILSVGWKETGGLKYLEQNEATMAITNPQMINDSVEQIIHDSYLRKKLAENAWNLGTKNHQITKIWNNLYSDILEVLIK